MLKYFYNKLNVVLIRELLLTSGSLCCSSLCCSGTAEVSEQLCWWKEEDGLNRGQLVLVLGLVWF